MIRKFVWDENEETLEKVYIGTDREIRSLYKNLEGKYDSDCRDFIPLFPDFPILRKGGMYGIQIDKNGYYVVINSDTITRMMVDGDFVDVELYYEFHEWSLGNSCLTYLTEEYNIMR